MHARRRPLHYAFGSIPWARMLQALGKLSGNSRMNSNLLLYAMFFHVCWMALLYLALTVLRAPSIWGVDTASGAIRKWSAVEPRVSANLSNQFEWPLLFYVCCMLVLIGGEITSVAAWITIGEQRVLVHQLLRLTAMVDYCRLQ